MRGEHGQIHNFEEKPLPTYGAEEVSKNPRIHAQSKLLQTKAPQALDTAQPLYPL